MPYPRHSEGRTTRVAHLGRSRASFIPTSRALAPGVGGGAAPLFATPAIIHTTNGFIQISPADERCSLGELTIRQDSTRQWPELSGELFTVRQIDSTERK